MDDGKIYPRNPLAVSCVKRQTASMKKSWSELKAVVLAVLSLKFLGHDCSFLYILESEMLHQNGNFVSQWSSVFL